MANFVKLVVSGKEFPEISKEFLIESSGYFRVLFNGSYNDCNKNVYTYSGWSSKAFEFLLRYIVTGKILFKGQNLIVIKSAMDMADFLLVDGFKPELSQTVISSWTDLEFNSVFQLANELRIREDLEEAVYSGVLSAIENDQPKSITYDMLILVTGMKKFWVFNVDTEEFLVQDVLWKKVIRKYGNLMEAVKNLPPNYRKAQNLSENINLLILGRRHWTRILNMLDVSCPGQKCLRIALQNRLIESRHDVRHVLAHIRIPFSEGCSKLKTFGVAEFDTNCWSWRIKKYEGTFESTHSVMKRNTVLFLGPTGFVIIRKSDTSPVLVDYAELGDIMNRYANSITCCVLKKYIFMYYTDAEEGIFHLKKLDMFSLKITNCVSLVLSGPCVREHGNSMYIAGYKYDAEQELCVFRYNLRTNNTTVIIRSNCVQLPVLDILVIQKQMLIFFTEAFTTVDRLKAKDQKLNVVAYSGLLCHMWDFDIVNFGLSSVGSIILLLKVFCLNWGYPELMTAQFNPVSGEFTCLGYIPNASEFNPGRINLYRNRSQIKVRHPSCGALSDSQEIMEAINCLD